MEKSATIGKLAASLAAFQGKVSSVKKDSENPYYKSKYASLGNIIDTIKGPLAECGLSYCQFPDGDEGLTTILMHGESGEYLQATYNIHPKAKDPQGVGSALTYARRYALSALLGLNTDEDDDAQGDVSQGRSQQQKDTAEAMLKLTNCANVNELDMFKSTLPAHVLNDTNFINASDAKMKELDKNNPFKKIYKTAAGIETILAQVTELNHLTTLYNTNKDFIEKEFGMKEKFTAAKQKFIPTPVV